VPPIAVEKLYGYTFSAITAQGLTAPLALFLPDTVKHRSEHFTGMVPIFYCPIVQENYR
jgi:hypothetical protein